jgi:hypothetical protein
MLLPGLARGAKRLVSRTHTARSRPPVAVPEPEIRIVTPLAIHAFTI